MDFLRDVFGYGRCGLRLTVASNAHPNSSIRRKLGKDSGFHGSVSAVFGSSFSDDPAEFRRDPFALTPESQMAREQQCEIRQSRD